MTLSLSDFPAGWSQEINSGHSGNSGTSGEGKCQIDRSGLTITANSLESAPSFKGTGEARAVGGATVMATEAQAKTAFQRVSDGSIAKCFADRLEDSLKASLGDEQVEKARLSVVSFPPIGDESTLYRIELPISSAGFHSSFFVDYLFFRVNRAVGMLLAMDVLHPFDSATLQQLAEHMAARGKGKTSPSTTTPTAPPASGGRLAYVCKTQVGVEICSTTLGGHKSLALTSSKGRNTEPAWSRDGRMLAFTSDRSGTSQVWVMTADGTHQRQLTHGPAQAETPTWAADGKKIAYSVTDMKAPTKERALTIWVINVDGSGAKRIAESAMIPAWSPDGTAIAYTKVNDTGTHIWLMKPDGSNQRELIPGVHYDYLMQESWSPDGTKLAFAANTYNTHDHYDIWVADLGSGHVTRLTHDGDTGDNQDPTWSPDGSQIVWDHLVAKRYHIWIMNADGSNPQAITGLPPLAGQPAWQPPPIPSS